MRPSSSSSLSSLSMFSGTQHWVSSPILPSSGDSSSQLFSAKDSSCDSGRWAGPRGRRSQDVFYSFLETMFHTWTDWTNQKWPSSSGAKLWAASFSSWGGRSPVESGAGWEMQFSQTILNWLSLKNLNSCPQWRILLRLLSSLYFLLSASSSCLNHNVFWSVSSSSSWI